MSNILICQSKIKYKSWTLHENYVLFLKGSHFLDTDQKSKILGPGQSFASMKNFLWNKLSKWRKKFYFSARVYHINNKKARPSTEAW